MRCNNVYVTIILMLKNMQVRPLCNCNYDSCRGYGIRPWDLLICIGILALATHCAMFTESIGIAMSCLINKSWKTYVIQSPHSCTICDKFITYGHPTRASLISTRCRKDCLCFINRIATVQRHINSTTVQRHINRIQRHYNKSRNQQLVNNICDKPFTH
jgi:hypothetical protein